MVIPENHVLWQPLGAQYSIAIRRCPSVHGLCMNALDYHCSLIFPRYFLLLPFKYRTHCLDPSSFHLPPSSVHLLPFSILRHASAFHLPRSSFLLPPLLVRIISPPTVAPNLSSVHFPSQSFLLRPSLLLPPLSFLIPYSFLLVPHSSFLLSHLPSTFYLSFTLTIHKSNAYVFIARLSDSTFWNV